MESVQVVKEEPDVKIENERRTRSSTYHNGSFRRCQMRRAMDYGSVTFVQRNSLLKHFGKLELAFPKQKVILCREKRKLTLKNHVKTHQSIRKLTCKCGCLSRKQLSGFHQNTCLGLEKWSCVCGKVFSKKKDLKLELII